VNMSSVLYSRKGTALRLIIYESYSQNMVLKVCHDIKVKRVKLSL
jgi:hypothetical protein